MSAVVPTIKDCKRCALSAGRKNIVNGFGPAKANIMLIGEAPGEKEDSQGKPFVGRSGKFLDKTLESLKTPRDAVFITNVVRCRPPANRKPTVDEAKSCIPYLFDEIDSVRPQVIVTLGATALENLFPDAGKLKGAVGKKKEVAVRGFSTILIPCYHPSAAMRSKKMSEVFHDVLASAIAEAAKAPMDR